MYMFLGFFSSFLQDDCFSHCIFPIISFLVGDTSASSFSSTDDFFLFPEWKFMFQVVF